MLHRVRVARVDRELFLADRRLMGDREAGARRCVAPPVAPWRVTVTRSPGDERMRRQEALAGAGRVGAQHARVHAAARADDAHVATRSSPAAPRKLIWVLGEASGVPGSGETATGLAAAAAASAPAFEHGRVGRGGRPAGAQADAHRQRRPAARSRGSSSSRTRERAGSSDHPAARVERLHLEARVALPHRDRRLEARTWRRSPRPPAEPALAPASTRQETTSVAPFQLAYTVVLPSVRRAAPAGGVSGRPTHGSSVAR